MNQREIKFRAWDTNKKKMWSAKEMGVDELSLNPDGRGFCNPNPQSPSLTTYMTWMIPLQFTGLKDKNGKEIYEGDIIENKDFGKRAEMCEGWTKGMDKYISLQFTGLKDSRGFEIYEGDIIENKDFGKRVVVWDRASWVLSDGNPIHNGFISNINIEELWKVIGNIYENSNLLK